MFSDGSHVVVSLGTWPVSGQNSRCIRIPFDLPESWPKSCPLKAKFQAADPREQRSYGPFPSHHYPSPVGSVSVCAVRYDQSALLGCLRRGVFVVAGAIGRSEPAGGAAGCQILILKRNQFHIIARRCNSPYRTPPPKDARLAVALAFFFGPLGLLYSAPISAIVTLLVSVPVAFFTFGLGLIPLWGVCLWLAWDRVQKHNAGLS